MPIRKPGKPFKEKQITVATVQYVDLLVLDLLEQADQVYKSRNFKGRIRQVSIRENTYSTAGIVLTVIAIEGWRSRIQYLVNNRKSRIPAGDFISELFKKNQKAFPATDFLKLTNEVFTLRDLIAHNYLYELTVTQNSDYDVLSQRQKLLPMFGDQKHRTSMNSLNRKTHILKLNGQPLKIGFEDLFKVLSYYDLFLFLCRRILGEGYVSIRNANKFRGIYEENFSSILATLFGESKHAKFRKEFNNISKYYRRQYSKFLATSSSRLFKQPMINDTCVAHNECPRCGMFGYHKTGGVLRCHACKHTIKLHTLSPQQMEKLFGPQKGSSSAVSSAA